MDVQKSDSDYNSTENTSTQPEIEENTTFYYSNFKLFNEQSEHMFTKYLLFKNNLKSFLGEDWLNYAKTTVYKSVDGKKVFPQGDVVFSSALEVWLELRREINFDLEVRRADPKKTKAEKPSEKIDEETKSNGMELKVEQSEMEQETAEDKFEDNSIVEHFDQKLREKFKNFEIDDANYIPVFKGFYISAVRVWANTLTSFDSNNKSEGFVSESKKYIMNKLQNLYNSKAKMLKPILVATEKIKDYIYEKPKQIHSETSSVSSVQDEKELKNLENFNTNFNMETCEIEKSEESEDLKNRLSSLSITDKKSESIPRGVKRRNPYAKGTVIEIKKINRKTERMLNQNMIEYALNYINTIVKTTTKDWQITRTFVTNMVEVNYNRLLQLENKLSVKASELKNEIKIRFIQPAQGFYNQLLEIWIIFKTNSLHKEILFTEYLDKVKGSLGNLWSDRFISPTQNFFMTLYYEWNRLKAIETEHEEKIRVFINQVKENLNNSWEENIVKKAEELTNKKINF